MFKKNQLAQKSRPQIFQSKNQKYLSSYEKFDQQDELNIKLPTSQSPEKMETQNFDIRRLRRAVYQFQGQIVIGKNEDEQENQEKTTERRQAVKMNVFRQSARQQQRQFHQQNHQFLRMFSVMAHSATNADKFRIKEYRQGNGGQNKGQNKNTKSQQNFATVHLQLQTEMTSSLINYKFPVKDIYSTVPFKKESIEIQCREYLDPKFEFFVFEKCTEKVELVRQDLKNVLEEGLTTQFKGSVIRAVGNLDFFEFLDLTNYRQYGGSRPRIVYPPQVLQIAQQNEIFQLNSDQQQFYTRGQIRIEKQDTNQRMVGCQDFDLHQTDPSIYFQQVEQYTIYKKYRQIQFKKLKIYDKDITINTDIRNIISSQKIYLIQLIKQIELYIEISTFPIDIKIMKEIHRQLRRKAEEFLKVICNYTESKILKHYNIDNYHEKISMFIQKSIKYEKEIYDLPSQMLKEFPILKIWYEIPKILFGYSRENVHRKYYDLVKTILIYEEKIKDYQLQKQLSIKRSNIKYPE